MSGADVVEALCDVMCDACPRRAECSDLDDQEDEQLISCIYRQSQANTGFNYPERLDIEAKAAKCPHCQHWNDMSDDDVKIEGTPAENVLVKAVCWNCKRAFDVTVDGEGYLVPQKRRGRPIGVKNKPKKRGRGRPRGSTNRGKRLGKVNR